MKNDFFKDVPPWAKGVVVVAGVAAVGIVAYIIAKSAKDTFNPTDAKKEIDAAKDEIKSLQAKGQKPSLSPSQLQTIANQIQTAFDGVTEDESSVYRAFANCNSDLDILNLKAAYGSRRTGYWYWSYFTGTLSQTITHYFNKQEIKALNDMLARKGIKYRF